MHERMSPHALGAAWPACICDGSGYVWLHGQEGRATVMRCRPCPACDLRRRMRWVDARLGQREVAS